MNMSYGVQAAPSATGEAGVADSLLASSTSNASSTPLPPPPAPFSMPSASFTFQGPSGNVLPPSRHPSAPAAFPFTGVPPRFSYPSAPAVPPSTSPVPPFSVQHGFPFPNSAGNSVQPMVNMGNLQAGGAGQNLAVGVRPLHPTGMQLTLSAPAQGAVQPPLQVAATQGSQGPLPGSAPVQEGSLPQVVPTSTGTGAATEASSAAPPGSLQVPAGTPALPVAPSTATHLITGLPGQGQMSAVPPSGAVSVARPGMPLPTSNSLPYAPPRSTFTTPVAGAAIVPPGGMVPRFPSPPFMPLVRPTFPPRVGAPLVRPPPGALLRPGPLLRPDLTKAAGAYLLLEKPQTLVYVGKIASTVDDEFLRSVLELCGTIKSWKRAQEPTTGTPKGFGFCEFELPDGVLRALRLLNGFSLEGQELLITVNQTTKEYLERFVQKKRERELQAKLEASQAADAEVEMAPGVEVPEPVKKLASEAEIPSETTEKQEPDPKKFGLVNDEDRERDEEAQKKLASLLEERAKTRPLPPPPSVPTTTSDAPCNSNSMSDTPAKCRGGDSVVDGGKSGGQEGNIEEESIKDKASSEHEKLDTGSSEQGRRLDFYRDRSRDRDRERDRDIDRGRDRGGRDRERERERERQEKEEREEEQSEREREKKRARREKDREMRSWQAERQFDLREREWERDEKEKERRRNVDREKEKEREKLRKRLIKEQEEGIDEEARKKAKRRGGDYDEHKRRQKEKEDDEYDRLKEQDEIAEAKQKKLQEEYEEQVRKRLAEIAEKEGTAKAAMKVEDDAMAADFAGEAGMPNTAASRSDAQGYAQVANGCDKEASKSEMETSEVAGNVSISMDVDEKRSSSPPQKKLGFGLIGSGKRTVVPSVFNQEDDEEAPKERAFRELVPIDYTAEEMQVVSSLKTSGNVTGAAPNLAAAADYAKSLSNLGYNSREELDSDYDKGRRQSEKFKKERERSSRDDNERSRDRDKEKHRQADGNRETTANAKLDTKQLIDTIPKTKEELFAYKIDWKIYDQHQLHERMKPWIQKKILEFLGEEEETLVEFIVSNTRKHTGASEMLALLTTILDDEAEMFVMKLWRMLIFEVKKIEMGLAAKPRG